RSVRVSADFKALLARRIEHATLQLGGAQVSLPLPHLNSTPTPSSAAPSRAPVQLVSIDEIVLQDVDVISGGRTLHGNIDLVPQGSGLIIRRIELVAADMKLTVTGELTDLSGPVGTLTMNAGAVNIDELIAFANDFSRTATLPES